MDNLSQIEDKNIKIGANIMQKSEDNDEKIVKTEPSSSITAIVNSLQSEKKVTKKTKPRTKKASPKKTTIKKINNSKSSARPSAASKKAKSKTTVAKKTTAKSSPRKKGARKKPSTNRSIQMPKDVKVPRELLGGDRPFPISFSNFLLFALIFSILALAQVGIMISENKSNSSIVISPVKITAENKVQTTENEMIEERISSGENVEKVTLEETETNQVAVTEESNVERQPNKEVATNTDIVPKEETPEKVASVIESTEPTQPVDVTAKEEVGEKTVITEVTETPKDAVVTGTIEEKQVKEVQVAEKGSEVNKTGETETTIKEEVASEVKEETALKASDETKEIATQSTTAEKKGVVESKPKKATRSPSKYYKKDAFTDGGPLDLDRNSNRKKYHSLNKKGVKDSSKKNLTVDPTYYTRSYSGKVSDVKNPWNSGGPLDLDHPKNVQSAKRTSRD